VLLRAIKSGDWRCELSSESILVRRRDQDIGRYPLLKEPYCKRCSSLGFRTQKCPWHSRFPDALVRIFAVSPYYPLGLPESGLLDDHVNRLKTDAEYAIPIGLAMSLMMLERYETDLKGFEALVPVPLYQSSLTSRGYNQAEELARRISKECKIGQISLLRKTREVKQRGSGMDARWSAVKGAYSCDSSCDAESVLLIDDVSTSGATVSECADVLSRHGVKMVCALVAARDTNRPSSQWAIV